MRKFAIALVATLCFNGMTAQAPQKKQPTPEQIAERKTKIEVVRTSAEKMKPELHAKVQQKLAQAQLKIVQRRQQLYRELSQHIKPAARPALQKRVSMTQSAMEELNRTKQPISLEKYWPKSQPAMNPPTQGAARQHAADHAVRNAQANSSQTGTPVITKLGVTSGQPGDPVWIYGTGFNNTSTVKFLVANGNWQTATVDYADATDIITEVPQVSGVTAFTGGIVVSNGQTSSTIAQFQFQPDLTTLALPIVLRNVSWSDPACVTNGGGFNAFSTIETCGVQNNIASQLLIGAFFDGGKADDTFFSGYTLSNGWVLDSVDLTSISEPFTDQVGAQVQNAKFGSSSASFKVHSYVNAWMIEGYAVTAYIRGPEGVSYEPRYVENKSH